MKQMRVCIGIMRLMVFSSILCSSGCSLCGYVIGDNIDNSRTGRDTVAFKNIEQLSEGDAISILINDSVQLDGRFVELILRSEQEYTSAYEGFRSSRNQLAFPRLGDTILLQIYPAAKWSPYQFLGFESWRVRARSLTTGKEATLRWHNILSAVYRDTTFIDVRDWYEAFNTNSVPVISALKLKTELGEQLIRLEDIQVIQRSGGAGAKWTGLVLGACVDAVLLVTVAKSFPGGF